MTSNATPPAGLWHRIIASGLPHRRRTVEANEHIARAGERQDHAYVPIDVTAVIVRQTALDPVPLTVALIGPEGMVGWPALLGADHWHHDAVAIGRGDMLAIATADLAHCGTTHPDLYRLLLRVAHNHTLQLAQSVVANLGHSVERRLARWLTMLDDRSSGDELNVTHDRLAQLLNVRRATVTDLLHILEGELLIRNTRGRLQVRDRAGLEARAGQSYGLSEHDYNAAIGPFGKRSAEQA